MRRILTVGLMFLFAAIPVFAQRGGGMRGGGGRGGGMRGGGFGGMHGGGFARSGGFAHRPSFRSNFGFQRFPRTVIFPGFYGGFGFYDSYPSYAYPNAGYGYSAPPVTIVTDNYYGYPAPEPPQAIIDQGYHAETAPPAVREEPKYEQPLYLVAFADHSIRAVLAYWVDGATLHYVTMDREQKQTPLASVDRALSDRLNRERGVTFHLPLP